MMAFKFRMSYILIDIAIIINSIRKFTISA
jgi:hypothetical protein